MLNVPDELDFLSFFESEPVESSPEDGFYCYKITDSRGLDLYFSFHEIEASIQARLVLNGKDIALFSEECATKISIEKGQLGEYLACYFELNGAVNSKSEIHVRPEIKVGWYTLKI